MPLPRTIRNSQARVATLRRLADDARVHPRQQVVARHLATAQKAALKLRVRGFVHAAKGRPAAPG